MTRKKVIIKIEYKRNIIIIYFHLSPSLTQFIPPFIEAATHLRLLSCCFSRFLSLLTPISTSTIWASSLWSSRFLFSSTLSLSLFADWFSQSSSSLFGF